LPSLLFYFIKLNVLNILQAMVRVSRTMIMPKLHPTAMVRVSRTILMPKLHPSAMVRVSRTIL